MSDEIGLAILIIMLGFGLLCAFLILVGWMEFNLPFKIVANPDYVKSCGLGDANVWC